MSEDTMVAMAVQGIAMAEEIILANAYDQEGNYTGIGWESILTYPQTDSALFASAAGL